MRVLAAATSLIPSFGRLAVKQIIVPTLFVNRTNVEEFTRRINTLRGR